MRAVLSLVLLGLGSYSFAAQAAPSFNVGSILNTARERAAQNLLPPVKGADQDVFDHVFRSYPKDRGTCEASAKKIAADFAAATGIETLGAVCMDETDQGFDIAVQYRAASKIKAVSTAQNRGIHPASGWESKQECEDALEAESARFTKNTGLKPAAAYCHQERFPRRDEWTMRIESLGDARLSPQLTGAYVFGKVLGHSRSSFLDAIKAGMVKQGFDVSFVRYRASMAYGEIGVLYYGTERIRMESVEYVKLAEKEQCEEQLGLARAALGDSGELISYCGAMSITGNFEVSYLFAGTPRSSLQHYKKYDSYAACMAARVPTLENFRGQGRSVVGALCGRTERDWRVVLLND